MKPRRIFCPWPWLLALLILTLGGLWEMQRRRIRQKVKGYTMFDNNSDFRTRTLRWEGLPTFHDPFGNLYYLPTGETAPSRYFIITFDWNGQPCRTLTCSKYGKLELDVYPGPELRSGDLLPFGTFSLGTLFLLLWIRAAARNQARLRTLEVVS